MMKIKKYLILLLAITIAIPSLVFAVTPSAPKPNDSYTLYGTIKIDGANAPINTRIGVEKSNVEIAHTLVTTAGEYIIENVAGINTGDTLVYKVSNADSSSQPFTTSSNALFKADLVFTTNTPAPAPVSSGGGGGGAFISNPPTNTSISINNGADTTSIATVHLSLSAKNATTMAISNNSSFTNGFWENYSTDRDWILSSGEGTKTVYVKFRSSNGDVSSVVSDDITFRTGEVLGVKIDERQAQLDQILYEASYVYPGDATRIANEIGLSRDNTAEASGSEKYTVKLMDGINGLAQSNINAITNFIVYGTPSTKQLGAGERAGVLDSYKSAFSKLPKTEAEWVDVIKIANGRWPSETSATAEANAKTSFEKVYLREADMNNANDNAAVTIMAYGLRSADRNMDSEASASKIFKGIFGYNPVSAIDWDITRAIAYSGAIR